MPAQAALVDNGFFTTDSSAQIDWLDLTATAGMTSSAALAANSGWRLATNGEVEGLFATAFDGYYLNSNGGLDASTSHWQKAGPEYAGHTTDAALWQTLFGTVPSGGGNNYYSYGMYQDESGSWRMTGSQNASGDPNNNGPWDVIFGLDWEQDLTTAATGSGDYKTGVFLVRSSVVPVPAAVWLFG